MKQFTYKEFDTITGIVFTNLCCDMLNRFDIDMFNDVSSRPIFEALASYIGNNVKIKEGVWWVINNLNTMNTLI